MVRKKRLVILLSVLVLVLTLPFLVQGARKKVVLRMPIYGQQDYDYFNKINLTEKYKKVNPKVTIEIEKVKDTGEFETAIRIRRAANELPELLVLKPYMLATYKDILEPLNNLEAAKKNKFAQSYKVDGVVVGVPQISFNEFVYYRKSIFKEYGLSVPKTWNQFIAAAKKIKAGGKYVPILLGAKDAWPDYPFNEFMPCLEANDGQLWNKMATQDQPFTKDKPFYKAYKKIDKLYKADVFGQDPLGIGFDQAKALFAAKKGAIICAGQWFLQQYEDIGGDMNDLGLFLLPVRDRATETLNTIAMADQFLAVPKDSKYKKEAKDFINWFFSQDFYPDYIEYTKLTSTVQGIDSEVLFLKEAFRGVDVNFVLYDGGNAEFKKISDAIRFDVKRMGQEMLAGKDLDEMMNKLNRQWKDARANLK